MYLKKTHLPFLFIAVTLGCKPKIITTKNKVVADTAKTDSAVVNEKSSVVRDVKLSTVDTLAVLEAFKMASKTAHFIDELSIDRQGESGGSIFDLERPILIGDLNNDHLDDAIMPFAIEGRQGGNNWDLHYAVFINNGGKLEYKYSFDRGTDLSEIQIDFKNIKNGVIEGLEVPGAHTEQGDTVAVNYIYRENDLSELASAVDVK